MNILLFLAIIYFSGVITNVLIVKIVNKFKPIFVRSDMPFVWFSYITWFFAFILGVGCVAEWLNDKFKNWLFK